MTASFKLSCLPMALCTALGLAATAWPALAAQPSIDTVLNFTGNQAGGGNGSMPSLPLSEASDGYLYSYTRWGGGTDADAHAGDSNSEGFGDYGGWSTVMFRIRNDGTGHEVIARNATLLPNNAYYGGWFTGPDGALYSPNPATRGPVLHRYSFTDRTWSTYGVSGTNTGATVATVSQGNFIVGRLSLAVRAISADGAIDTSLFSMTNTTGTTPTYAITDTDGTVYMYMTSGGGAGSGALTRVVTDGTAAGTTTTRLCGFDTSVGMAHSTAYRPLAIIGDWIYAATINGTYGGGALIRLRKDGSAPATLNDSSTCPNAEVLHSFATGDLLGGAQPTHLVAGQDGHLYGLTQGGLGLDGAAASGHVFRYRIVPGGTNVLEALHSFSDARPDPARNNTYTDTNNAVRTSIHNLGANAGGHTPMSLLQAANGQFYGMTRLGGSYGWGTIFRFNPGDEVPADATIRPVEPHVVLGVGSFNAKADSASFALGQWTSFYWSGILSDSCVASTNEPNSTWTGAREREARTYPERITPATVGTWTYTLTCTPTSGSSSDPVSASVTLNVVPVVGEERDIGSGKGGGGSLAGWLLAPLAGLGALAVRRRRTHRAALATA